MGQGNKPSNLGYGKIIAIYKEGWSLRQTLEDVKGSYSAARILLHCKKHGKGSSWGRDNKKFNKQHNQKVVWTALQSKITASELKTTV